MKLETTEPLVYSSRQLQEHVVRATAAVQSAKDRRIMELEAELAALQRQAAKSWLPEPRPGLVRDIVAHRLIEEALDKPTVTPDKED